MPVVPHAEGDAGGQPQSLPAIELNIGIHRLVAEIADSPAEHALGLMYREDLGPSEGMLFVFPQMAKQCFWMKNTPLPLSAAFIADDGTVVNIEDMAPRTTTTHCSRRPVRFVLEMHQGWFAQRGLRAGSRVDGPPWPRSGPKPTP